MWPCMRRICMLVCCVGAAFGVLAGAAAAGSELTETYTDPVGDAGTGADIGNTTVSSSAGALTFRIEVPNRSAWVSGEQVNLFLNTDENQLNNNLGAEYAIFTNAFQSGIVQTQFGRWNASTEVYDMLTPPSFSGSFGNGVIQARVSLADLGGPTLIDVDVWSFLSTGVADTAPDSFGWYPTFDTRDADSDSISDSKDACPNESSVGHDPNHDGCLGPFDKVGRPTFLNQWDRVGRALKFREAELDLVENGARVVVRVGSRSQTSTKRPGRALVIRILIGRTLSYGTVISVSITKPDEIGWYGQYRVTTRGLRRFSEKCIPPGGGSPRACSLIDPGQ